MGQYSIVGLIANTLAKRLLIPSGWLFPSRIQAGPAPTPGTEYLNELITGPNVLDLMAREPWNELRNPGPLTFDLALHEREGTPLAAVAATYRVLMERHLQAFWEATHNLDITASMQAADLTLQQYYAARKSRRGRASSAWRQFLASFPTMMRDQWFGLDLLLDPFFLHLPVPTVDVVRWYPGVVSRRSNLSDPTLNLAEPADLIEALLECDEEEPWRNQYRNNPADNPAHQIPRLAGKFDPRPGAPSP
ncbi:hypothetical protein P3T76_001938 [Phytophthora citrophthora]|uniref:Uncharacterized protein n=1 Tax=Phytophthora citrophthora TaxID=4793 RepID=A0AAD9LQV6_9STRA|nr:hypothetical protein P3T76_001938 [Phytophthora citrophthora]